MPVVNNWTASFVGAAHRPARWCAIPRCGQPSVKTFTDLVVVAEMSVGVRDQHVLGLRAAARGAPPSRSGPAPPPRASRRRCEQIANAAARRPRGRSSHFRAPGPGRRFARRCRGSRRPGPFRRDARTRRGLWQGKRLDTWKVGWASDGRKSDHGVVPLQDAGASTCDIQGPGPGWGRHRNGNDKARSHASKIVVSIGVELRARPGGPIPNCPPKPRCTSVSGPIRAVWVPARDRISRCLSDWFPTPRPVVDAPDT